MDRDVYTAGEGRPRWRSREVERQKSLTFTGVFAAIQDPIYGQAANLRRTLIICAAALLALTAMVAVGVLRHDGPTPLAKNVVVVPADDEQVLVAADPNATGETLAGLGFQPLQAEPSPDAAASAEPNRANCAAIQGTPYESESERIWYLNNCIIEEPVVAAYSTGPELAGAVYEPATVTTGPAEGTTEGDAVATTVDYIISQPDAPYEVPAGGCAATEVGALWVVSCETSLRDCDLDECTSWVSLCVMDADGELLATENC